jgi:gluconate 5-dehydrogenase
VNGAHVWLNGRTADPLERAIAQIVADGGLATPLPFDITDQAAIDVAFERIKGETGRLDILVNNVGLRDRRCLFKFDLVAVRRLLEADLVAPFELARRAAKLMIEGGRGGRIVNVSSVAGPLAGAGDAPYTMAKAGVDGLTRALRPNSDSTVSRSTVSRPAFSRLRPMRNKPRIRRLLSGCSRGLR